MAGGSYCAQDSFRVWLNRLTKLVIPKRLVNMVN